MNFISVSELETEACRSIFEYKCLGSHVSAFTRVCVCVCVCEAAVGGASGPGARPFTVWNLMGSGNVLYALASMIHYE